MFDNVEERAQAVAVPLFYGIVEAVAIGLYCVWAWKVGWTKAPADERICVVVTKSYEINRDEDDEHEHRSDDGEGDEGVVVPPSRDASFGDEQDALNGTEAAPRRSWWQRLFGGKQEREPEMPKADAFTTPPPKNSRGRASANYTGDTAPPTPPDTSFHSERAVL